MNFYLLNLVGKWLSLGALSVMSLFGFSINETNYKLENLNIKKNVNITTDVIEYETIKSYNSSIPSNITRTVVEGKDGIIFHNGENTVILEEKIDEEIQVGTGKSGIYNGVMTGYGPDCSTCSGRGYVACHTEDKKSFNLLNDGVYYDDRDFGEARVLAAALTEFPCGTIIEVDSKNMGKFTGIVLDTGYDMRKHLEEGIYHFDVAFTTEKDKEILKTTDMSGNVVYNVQRWGW